MRSGKRFLSVFLSVCMLSSFMAVTFHAYAEEDIAYAVSEYVTYDGNDHIGEVIEDLYQAEAAVKSGLDSLKRDINVVGMGLTKDNIDDFYFSLLFDNPQYFYVYTSYKYIYSEKDNSVISIKPKYITSDKEPGDDTEAEIAQQNIEINKMKTVFNKNTEKLMSSINDSMSDVEKLLALHDALACHMTYSKDTSGKYKMSVYTAYGSIAEGNGVCQAYTLGYSYLAKLAGIDDIHVVSNKYHSWNMVKLDEQWYHIDVTFDDPLKDTQGRVLHKYFLISDKKLLENDKSLNHSEWLPSYSAESSKYESSDYFWTKTESRIVFDGDRIYYVDMSNKDVLGYNHGIITEINSDGSEKIITEVKDRWNAESGFYVGNYTRLFKAGDYLYYNSPKSVIKVNVKDGTEEIVFTLPDDINSDNNIFGLERGDGVLYIGYAKTPNDIMTVIQYSYDFEDTVSDYKIGDVDKNGIINIYDATEIQKYLVGIDGNFDISFADVDGSGLVDINDSTAVQKLIVGLA